MQGAVDSPDDQVVPCKKNKTHNFNLLLRWEDDLTPFPLADFETYRGKTLYVSDHAGNGKYAAKNVPPGTYQLFFSNIDESELIEE